MSPTRFLPTALLLAESTAPQHHSQMERGPGGFSCYTFLSCNFKFGGRGDLITYSRVGYMKKTINYGNLTPVLN